ncbi:MAG TPA: DUF2961 domain-containing protein [bacterium]|nr:DUF2961 domain-containing protein [bacterium]HPG46807.1 DUF2961 domain-containing protein [bacterium]HPM98863.1 DUF2961 domain-containing protein [bacterium]
MKKALLIAVIAVCPLWAQPDDQIALEKLKPYKLVQVSSTDTSGGNNDRINLQAGETAVIADLQGPGRIVRIWITIDSRDPHFLRRIVLRMFWDGEAQPSVEVPVGDFFGTGFGYHQTVSEYVGMTSGGYYCYFPMPFRKSARLEVENQTGREVYAFYYHIGWQRLDDPLPDDTAYFHAFWRRDSRTDYPQNYTVLEAKGSGHFVGLNMSMQGLRGNFWYLEGDEMVTVDGESQPSIYGTGTEDYFTSGWYFNRGEFFAPYHGLIVKDDSLARIAAYRLHIKDPIPFRSSLLFTIEHGHGNEEIADFSSTAYWYQQEPHKPFSAMLKASLRIPLRTVVPPGCLEAETLLAPKPAIDAQVVDMSDFGAEWSGGKQLLLAGKTGDRFVLRIPALEDRYQARLFYTKGPEYGKVTINHLGRQIAAFEGEAQEIALAGDCQLEPLLAKNGYIEIEFAIAGHSNTDSEVRVGLDALHLTPIRVFIPEWQVIGPFPNPRKSETERLGIDQIYPPEREIDLDAVYSGVDGQPVRWQKIQTPMSGYFSLHNLFKPYELVTAYALTWIYSPKKQTVPLLFSSDDGSKVFLNDEQLYRFLQVRIAAPDDERIPLKLKKGWNKLLLKIENNFGGYSFYARVLDLDHSLTVSATKQSESKQ